MKLAILGDIHLFTLRVSARRLVSKRVLCQANLWLNRRHRFDHAVLPAIVERVCGLGAERLLMSGDVSTSSLESEFEELRRHVEAVRRPAGEIEADAGEGAVEAVEGLDEASHQRGRALPVVLVPGNHDRYTFKSRRVRRIETLLEGLLPESFPHVEQLRDGWTLLALDSAIPNRVFSRGKLGREQFAQALRVIQKVEPGQGLVVLCHYPCVVPAGVPGGWTHDLAEAKPLREALQKCRGRVLYVHGHVHRPWFVDGPKGQRKGFACLNAGSPCLVSGKYPRGQGFWELTLPGDPVGGTIDAVHHAPADGDNGVVAWRARHYRDGREVL